MSSKDDLFRPAIPKQYLPTLAERFEVAFEEGLEKMNQNKEEPKPDPELPKGEKKVSAGFADLLTAGGAIGSAFVGFGIKTELRKIRMLLEWACDRLSLSGIADGEARDDLLEIRKIWDKPERFDDDENGKDDPEVA